MKGSGKFGSYTFSDESLELFFMTAFSDAKSEFQ